MHSVFCLGGYYSGGGDQKNREGLREWASRSGHLVQDLDEGSCLSDLERRIAIKHALSVGNSELVGRLLPPGSCVLDYAAGCPRIEVIEQMLDCGYLQRDARLAASTIPDLARSGSLGLAQSVFQQHSPLPRKYKDWVTTWWSAMEAACRYGHLPFLQWLVAHPLVSEAYERMKSARKLFCAAAEGGHAEVMEFLYRHGLSDDFLQATKAAINKGQSGSVRWLLEHRQCDEFKLWIGAVDTSAEGGHLEILKLFHELDTSSQCTCSSGAKRRRVCQTWYAQKAMYLAAKGGHLDVLEWFQANRWQSCDTDTMGIAASEGHLDVVKWLHQNRAEGCTKGAIDQAAAHGHLEVVQWLHANRPEGCLDEAMALAAGSGHLRVVKWLYVNIPTSQTGLAMDRAVKSGHFHVACWLQPRCPDHRIGSTLASYEPLASVDNCFGSVNIFEMVLFLHEYCNYVFTSPFLVDLRRVLASRWDPYRRRFSPHIEHWINAHYPLTSSSQ